MNKSSILGLVCALCLGQSAFAQSNQEVQYVEDPAQGYTFNRFQDNWFISGEGGANILFSKFDSKRDLSDRFAPNAGIWVGKWFSPIIGLRAGVNWTKVKGVGENGSFGEATYEPRIDGKYYKTKHNDFTPMVDVMLNLTNWWCGYKPNRLYNATFYGGGGVDFAYVPKYDSKHLQDGYEDGHNKTLTAHVGLINSFRLNNHFNIYLDVRYNVLANEKDEAGYNDKMASDLAAYVGVTYNFNKTAWSAPVVPVCPPVVDCDPVEQRLQAANARVADLEGQIRECLSRPAEVKEVAAGPLATVYYSINSSRVSRVDSRVLGAIAEIIKSNPDQKYVITGWADNYTGTDAYNDRLRKARAASVEKILLRNGVNPSQLEVTTNNGNLCDMGDKYVSLDRAVTIQAAE